MERRTAKTQRTPRKGRPTVGARYILPFMFLGLICLLGVTNAGVALVNAQADITLTPNTAVEGSITAEGESQAWTFRGIEGQVVSLYVRSAGSLDPTLTLSNSSGTILTQNDDIAYPGATDALLQAITLPRTDTYTATITGYKTTTGAYTLTLTHGYADIAQRISFAETGDGLPNEWKARQSNIIAEVIPGALALAATGIQVGGFAQDDSGSTYADFYLHTVITDVVGRNGWVTGVVLRESDQGYYVVEISDKGLWRMIRHFSGDERVIRDWTAHPAIVAGQASFSLGVLANSAAFDVFYNHAYVGQAIDRESPLTSGAVGLYLQTANAANSSTQVSFESVEITTPHQLGGGDILLEILPTQLIPGGQPLTIQELERRRVIPTGGSLAFTIPESFGQRAQSGVNRVPLVRGTTVGDMVMGTRLSWESAAAGVVGCGLVFGNRSDTDYNLAYIDQTGGYGLSSRINNVFLQGLFGENPLWADLDEQNLVVVRLGETVHYYINRQYVGTMTIPESVGELAVAVVNYDPIDTTCRFRDTWVWKFE